MGQSNIPLFAYIDESGNTGHNLLDEAQPDFFSAALITKGDFDVRWGEKVSALAAEVGSEALHANVLGIAKIEEIAEDFLNLLISSQASFFVARVEKRYLLATKIFDSLFDSGENAAVAWHHYNIRPLRLMLVFKFAWIIDKETAKLFWSCLLEPNKEKAYSALPDIVSKLALNIERLPDARSRQIIGEALEWARTRPECIHIHMERKIARKAHFPNIVAFANLLDGLDRFSKQHKRKVSRIIHDQQSEFAQTLKMFHELFTNASGEDLHWAGETYSLQKVGGSDFDIKSDSESPGIQIVDLVLWLYSQYRKERPLPPNCLAILAYVFTHGWENDFSFSSVEKLYIDRFGPILSAPLTGEKEKAAREYQKKAEAARQESMAQYDRDGLPPFMRGAPATLSDSGNE